MAASNGLEALGKIKENKFHAVVTDILMPEMDGLTLTKELLRHSQGLAVMVMTGHGDEYSAETAVALGAREFVKKPLSVTEFIIRFHKMMDDYREEEKLLALSLTDELTGLHNRRRFFVVAEQCLKLAIRMKKRPFLLFIDLDDLKMINDRYGHREGDQTLIGLANILKKTFRESDIIARIGGDEFVVLLEPTDENSETMITRLHENVKEYNAKRSQDILSISLGIAHFDPNHPISIDELLAKADALMYARKREKPNPPF
jgi:diguanylate cyclase (GGDEF)-like protein